MEEIQDFLKKVGSKEVVYETSRPIPLPGYIPIRDCSSWSPPEDDECHCDECQPREEVVDAKDNGQEAD